MANALPPELEHQERYVVTDEMTAHYSGNPGVFALATPQLVRLIEETAIKALAPYLAEGEGSVGTTVSVQHLAPTPVGMAVTIHATVAEVDGRRVAFTVEARDEHEQIASATHERFRVDLDRFLAGVGKKAAG